MPSGYDFAIFGSARLPALLAGLLAHDHGKQVLHIAGSVSSQRLPRRIDTAFSLATRPATWRLLQKAEAETRALLQNLDAAASLVPTDVQVVADRPETRAALDHMRHIAASYGVASHGDVFPRVSRFAGDVSLKDSRVVSVSADRVQLGLGDGSAEFSIDGDRAEIGRIVLADDGAILDLLPEAQRPPTMRVQSMTATLTAPTRALPVPLVRYPDRGATLLQRPDRSVLGLVEGTWEIDARLASCLPGPFPLRRLASTHFRRIGSSDGAPILGQLATSPVTLIAGLGDAAAFLAPPLARWLAGVSRDDEVAWFGDHAVTRTDRATVADYAPEPVS